MQNPINTIQEKHKKKKLIIFDLDGTLVETKSALDKEMAQLLAKLLESKLVAVISGGKYGFFQKQFLPQLKRQSKLFSNLFLFPTTATSFYRYQKGWKKIYSKELSKKERAMIKKAFNETFKEIGYVQPKKIYGKTIEDRKTQVTFSALGQDVVAVLGRKGVQLKKEWRDENQALKLKIAEAVQRRLPNLEVRAAGYTSIDVTRKGIDKEYGIRQIGKYLKVSLKDMLFIGDALFPGGNDYAALRAGVPCIAVKGPEDTKKLINFLMGKT